MEQSSLLLFRGNISLARFFIILKHSSLKMNFLLLHLILCFWIRVRYSTWNFSQELSFRSLFSKRNYFVTAGNALQRVTTWISSCHIGAFAFFRVPRTVIKYQNFILGSKLDGLIQILWLISLYERSDRVKVAFQELAFIMKMFVLFDFKYSVRIY